MTDELIDTGELFAKLPDLRIDRDNVEHYRGMLAGKLLINRCQSCGHWIYPHRPLCPECLSWNVKPTEVSGRGKLFMYTLIYQSRDPKVFLEEPIPVAAVELAEQTGLRYLSSIVGCPVHKLRYDMPLQLTWIDQDGIMVPAFEPADEGKA
jgi:uncharacterized OB-fold protein